MNILVDSNIFIDLFTRDEHWLQWSLTNMMACAEEAQLFINPIIYAEISCQFLTSAALDKALPVFIQKENLPWDAAFLAGQCFVQYRKNGGLRRSPMPDFYIGAHAVVRGMGLLTRDAQRYREYFPKLKLIAPR